MLSRGASWARIVCGCLGIFVAAVQLDAATIRIVVRDAAGAGFNDGSPPDAASTAGGNSGATIGAQRLRALQFAADLWGALLESPVEITLDAQFAALTCTCRDLAGNVVACNSGLAASFSGTGGQAGPLTVSVGFLNAPNELTAYPAALANSLAGADLNPAQSDVSATFNGVFGTAACPVVKWYYGLNGVLPANSIDFVSVAVHEIGHGLGMTTFMNLSTGQRLQGTLNGQPIDLDDPLEQNLEDHSTGKLYPEMTNAERVVGNTDTGDVHWIGSSTRSIAPFLTAGVTAPNHVQMFAPPVVEPAATLSHLSTALSPDQLLEPVLSLTTVNHSPGIGVALMRDLGWRLLPNVTNNLDGGAGSLRAAVAAAPNPGIVVLAPTLAGATIQLLSPITITGKTLLVDASRAPGVAISGATSGLAFITSGANLAIDGLSFLDGHAIGGGGLTGEGGAINSTGHLTLRNCTFGRCSAARGGAVFQHSGFTTILEGCTFACNTASDTGGAVYTSGGTLHVKDCTFIKCSAASGAGALSADTAAVVIESCTVAANSSNSAGGSAGGFAFNGGSVVIRNTILAGNRNVVGPRDCRADNVTVALQGHNFIGTTTGFAFTQESTDIIGVDLATVLKTDASGPLLEPNGGPTMTVQLLRTGSAVDGGNLPSTLRVDQRGAKRILDGNGDAAPVIDIGAYELGFPPELVTGDLPGGGVLRTNPPAGGATPADPVETSVVTPSGGSVSIFESESAVGDPTGYNFYGQRVLISAPDATVASPITITFWVDLSIVTRTPTGQIVLAMSRDGVPVGSCAVAGQANPSPCIASAVIAGDDLVVTVLSTRERGRTQPPCPCEAILTCPANITRSSSNPNGVAVTFQPTAVDGCGRALPVTCTPPSGSIFPQGATLVTCQTTDTNGAVKTCNFTVTVNCTDPTITCPGNLSVEATSATGAMATFEVTARNGCAGALPVTCTPASGSIFPLGRTTVACETTDDQGRRATCSFDVTVTCRGNPTITCPANMTVAATSPAGAAVTFSPTAQDGCGRNLTVNCSPASGATFPIGKTTVSCSATDADGKRGTCTFDVTVGCTGSPVVTCPQAITADCTSAAGAVVNFSATAQDSCGRNLTVTCNPAAGSVFPPGRTTVVCRATDDQGRTSQCSFDVTVNCVSQGGRQIPGDCNQDGSLDISDAICVLGYLFLGNPTRLPCTDTGGTRLADWDARGGVDLSDAVGLLSYIFSGGPPHALGASCVPIDGCPSLCAP